MLRFTALADARCDNRRPPPPPRRSIICRPPRSLATRRRPRVRVAVHPRFTLVAHQTVLRERLRGSTLSPTGVADSMDEQSDAGWSQPPTWNEIAELVSGNPVVCSVALFPCGCALDDALSSPTSSSRKATRARGGSSRRYLGSTRVNPLNPRESRSSACFPSLPASSPPSLSASAAPRDSFDSFEAMATLSTRATRPTCGSLASATTNARRWSRPRGHRAIGRSNSERREVRAVAAEPARVVRLHRRRLAGGVRRLFQAGGRAAGDGQRAGVRR